MDNARGEQVQKGSSRYQNKKDIEVWRGDFVESAHTISVAVVDEEGRLLYEHGDPYLMTNLRSSAKPFQLIPLIQALEESDSGPDFSSKELAIMAGSHSGSQEHAELVLGILEKIGLSEDYLLCGTHPPLGKDARKAIGPGFTPIHNNCSGKHAAMLALCQLRSYDTGTYYRFDHPVQQLIRRALSMVLGYPEEKIGLGVDGCGVPVFYFPLYHMALGFARFPSDRELTSHDYVITKETRKRIIDAMVQHPEMVAGKDRLDTDVMKVANGREKPHLISKVGAEGVGALSLLEEKTGVAIKIEDGGDRGVPPAIIHILEQMGILSTEQLGTLKKHNFPEIKNKREEVVGKIVPTFTLTPGT